MLPAALWGGMLSGGQGCAWNGQSGSHSCHQHSSCCGRKEGMEPCGCPQGTSSSPPAPLMGGQCCSSRSAEGCLGLHRALAFKDPTKTSARGVLRKSASRRNAFVPPWQEYCVEVNSQRIFWELSLPKICCPLQW